MDESKQEFLKVLKANAGILQPACEAFGISRATAWNWRKADPDFAAACEQIMEEVIDFAESKLYQNIKDGDNASIFFFLKCKAKHRGYVEKSELSVSGDPNGAPIQITGKVLPQPEQEAPKPDAKP